MNIDPVLELGTKRGCHGVTASKSSELPYAVAVTIIADKIVTKAFEDLSPSPDQQADLLGMRKDCPDPSPAPVYLARPLNGVWATAPYLHNGSVPTLYDLLTPDAQRPKSFCLGAREFDPQKVGLDVSFSCARGETMFLTVAADGAPILGNSNLGHSFEGRGSVYPAGVVGRALGLEALRSN